MKTKKYLLFILLLMSAHIGHTQSGTYSFNWPENEVNCFELFNDSAKGVDPVNVFLLAKFSEMMYPERLGYQLKYMQNGQQAVHSIPSSEWIKENASIQNKDFEEAFKARFQHYFYNPTNCPIPQTVTSEKDTYSIQSQKTNFDYCYWLDSTSWAEAELPKFHFIHKTAYWNKKKKSSIDPELIIISTPQTVLIVFRGTDRVGKDNDWGEWTGTDFKIGLIKGGGAFVNTKMHKGFWTSLDLIRDDLIRTLETVDARKKRIWLTGHSLGGAMAMLTGAYLKDSGYPIQNVYAFAAPRVLGNKKLQKRVDQLLPGRLHRFEYYLDPITQLWAPRYKHIGKRHWFDESNKGGYALHKNVRERYISPWYFHFHRFPVFDKRKKEVIRIKRESLDGWMPDLPQRLWYHNPQWYVMAAYSQLTAEQRAQLPAVDDPFPYLYDSAKGPMEGTR